MRQGPKYVSSVNMESLKPCHFNPFQANVSILSFLKAHKKTKKQRFSSVFWGYKMETLVCHGLIKFTDQKAQENSTIRRRVFEKITS